MSILIFVAFYLNYAASDKMQIQPTLGIEQWSQQNKRASRLLGLLFLILSTWSLINFYGIGVGLLIFILILMCIGSFIILLMPLRILSVSKLILIFVSFFIAESLLNAS